MTDLKERLARAICAETCAFYGEPPCYEAAGDDEGVWPNPDCDEPGCHALAEAAIRALTKEATDD